MHHSNVFQIDLSLGLKDRICQAQVCCQYVCPAAVNRSGIEKTISCRTFRHGFAVRLPAQNAVAGSVQEQMGHTNVRTAQVCLELLEKKDIGQLRPLDWL